MWGSLEQSKKPENEWSKNNYNDDNNGNYFFTLCKFFTPELSGLSQNYQRLQVSSGFQDSSKYSG